MFTLTIPDRQTLWEWNDETLSCTSPILERVAQDRLAAGPLPASPVGPWFDPGTAEAAMLAAEYAMRAVWPVTEDPLVWVAEGDVPEIVVPETPPGAVA